MADRLTLDVRFHVTKHQAAALMAMFDYWSALGSMGGSRRVGFYVDGDGNFHPRCQFQTSEPIRVDDKMKEAAVIEDDDGNRVYDYDPVAWLAHKRRKERHKRMKERDIQEQAERTRSEADGGEG